VIVLPSLLYDVIVSPTGSGALARPHQQHNQRGGGGGTRRVSVRPLRNLLHKACIDTHHATQPQCVITAPTQRRRGIVGTCTPAPHHLGCRFQLPCNQGAQIAPAMASETLQSVDRALRSPQAARLVAGSCKPTSGSGISLAEAKTAAAGVVSELQRLLKEVHGAWQARQCRAGS
jgi:hypothetical protein